MSIYSSKNEVNLDYNKYAIEYGLSRKPALFKNCSQKHMNSCADYETLQKIWTQKTGTGLVFRCFHCKRRLENNEPFIINNVLQYIINTFPSYNIVYTQDGRFFSDRECQCPLEIPEDIASSLPEEIHQPAILTSTTIAKSRKKKDLTKNNINVVPHKEILEIHKVPVVSQKTVTSPLAVDNRDRKKQAITEIRYMCRDIKSRITRLNKKKYMLLEEAPLETELHKLADRAIQFWKDTLQKFQTDFSNELFC